MAAFGYCVSVFQNEKQAFARDTKGVSLASIRDPANG
jgi:hypothetical protein